MSAPPALGRLHVLTDESLQSRHDHVTLARLAAEGGADVIQFREKRPQPPAERIETVLRIVDAVRPWGATVVVNDDPEVARAAGADGVHLGPDDPAPEVARRTLGGRALVGVTANDAERAAHVATGPADYLGVGPVFGTRSKANPAPPLGLRELQRIVAVSSRPVIAIGGITAERVAGVLAAGAWGVAVLSAVALAPDPALAVSRLRGAIDAAAGECGEAKESDVG